MLNEPGHFRFAEFTKTNCVREQYRDNACTKLFGLNNSRRRFFVSVKFGTVRINLRQVNDFWLVTERTPVFNSARRSTRTVADFSIPDDERNETRFEALGVDCRQAEK